MTDPKEELLLKVLGQNERLLDAVLRMAEAQSPVEIIKALNPAPLFKNEIGANPWSEDEARMAGADAWGDPEIPFDALAEVPGPGSREEDPEDG